MIYITGDLHGGYDSGKLFKVKYKPDDIVIVCGDFGYVWYSDTDAKDWEKRKLDKLIKKLGCTLLFAEGNHENFDRLEKYRVSKKYGGKVQKITENCYHLMRGERYDINGFKFLCIGGAESHDAQYRVYGESIWLQESITKEQIEKTISNCKDIDFIISHCAPSDFLLKMYLNGDTDFTYSETQSPLMLQKLLDTVEKQEKSWKWFMGHYHTDLNYEPFYVMYRTIYCVETGEIV